MLPPNPSAVSIHSSACRRVTVCVLLYGDHFQLADRCLSPLWGLARSGLIDLRIGCNEIGERTQSYLGRMERQFQADSAGQYRVIRSDTNKLKYPMMRDLFDLGGLARYTMWIDDDSVVAVGRDPESWLQSILDAMESCDQMGQIWSMKLGGNQHLWVKSQPWYANKEIKEGHRVRFCTGGWWTIRSKILADWDWPSRDITHRGGDVMLGELMRQQELRVVSLFPGVLVNAALGSSKHCSSPRRGYDSTPVGWNFAPDTLRSEKS